MPSRTTALALLAIGLAAPAAQVAMAQEPSPEPPVVVEAADAAIAAFAASDAERLRELAEADVPDAWQVAEELCVRGEHDVAAALAAATELEHLSGVAGYVARLREMPTPPAARKALGAVRGAMERRDMRAGIAALADVSIDDARTVTELKCLILRGDMYAALRRHDAAMADYAAAGRLASELGWLVGSEDSHTKLLSLAWRMNRNETMLEHAKALVEVRRRRGDATAVANAEIPVGIALYRMQRTEEAQEVWERALVVMREADNGRNIVMLLSNLGNAARRLGDLDRAIELYRESIEVSTELGDLSGVGHARGNLASVLHERGDVEEARKQFEAVLAESDSADPRSARGRAAALIGLGRIAHDRKQFADAARRFDEAASALDAHGWRENAAEARRRQGLALLALGDAPRAKAALTAARRDLQGSNRVDLLVLVLVDLASAELEGGDLDLALDYSEDAVRLAEERRLPPESVYQAGNSLADVRRRRGELDLGIRQLQAVLESPGLTDKLIRRLQGKVMAFEMAKANFQRIPESIESFRDDDGKLPFEVAFPLAATLNTLGRPADALAELATIRDDVVNGGMGSWHAEMLYIEAYAFAAMNRNREAIERTDELMGVLEMLFAGQSDDEGAQLRSRYAMYLVPGVRAAGAARDIEALTRFAESSQAGTLLEALGGREQLRSVALPPDLEIKGRYARDDERKALLAYQRAREERASLKVIRERKAAFEAARTARRAVIDEIQREARGAAALVYPTPATLTEIQAVLRPGEAFVHYVFFAGQAGSVALVIGPDFTRVAQIQEPTPAFEAGNELVELCGRPGGDAAERDRHIATVRALLVEPLELPETTKRLLVTARRFALSPLSLAVPELEVVHVPSGTVYRELTTERERRGEGVLGLGDPVYGTRESSTKSESRAGKLLPLPGTRKEVEAVADTRLLGPDATEGKLRAALAKRERWRALHLACHGLAIEGGGVLSALAITADDVDDGMLSAQEILLMQTPADLVVLSACETGRGKAYAGEGVVGLPRAFMVAGAPRVISSLWKVDDVATSALMIRFYEEWKTKSAVAALRAAKAHVRSQEGWSDPHFWAAWQLWGLPD